LSELELNGGPKNILPEKSEANSMDEGSDVI
jgi:hypothetical protein